MSEESRNWYRMTRPLFNSGFEDDEFWAYGQDGFQEVLDSFIGCNVLIYDKTIVSIPQSVRAIVQQKTSDVYNSTVVRQILCNIGILKCGQYVKYDNTLWMVSALPDNNRIYEKAVMWKCKHTIRLLSPLTGEIVEYPVYSTNSTQYGTGVSEKTNVDVGEDQHLIYLPYNEETILLDDGFRFIMDKNRVQPTVYKITRVDSVSYAVGAEHYNDGLIQWAVLEDKFDEATDSREEMIAGYYCKEFGGTENESGSNGTITLTDLDGDYTIAAGEQKQIRVSCIDADGNAITLFSYRLECNLLDGAVTLRDDTAGTITLIASDNILNIGQQVEIRASSEELNSEATIKIQIVNW